VDEYWNHNTAYHRWLLDIAARHYGEVLDVGCGEGLLVQLLAALMGSRLHREPVTSADRSPNPRKAWLRFVRSPTTLCPTPSSAAAFTPEISARSD
jgi:hypothetical protein